MERLDARNYERNKTLSLPIVLVPHPHVRIDPKIMGGSPYVVGSRVPVRRLWMFYLGGVNIERLLLRYPKLTPAKILDALAFALDNEEVIDADMVRETELLAKKDPSPRRKALNQMELPFALEKVRRRKASPKIAPKATATKPVTKPLGAQASSVQASSVQAKGGKRKPRPKSNKSRR